MILRISVTLAVFAILICPTLAADPPSEEKPPQVWSGKQQDESLLKKFTPKTEFIADADAWEKLWKAWRPGEELPKIDFSKSLVLVGTAYGPNRANMRPMTDDDGNLKFVVFSTKIGGPGFGYTLMVVDRDGIKTVNGHAVPAVDEDSSPAKVADSIKVTVVGTLRTGLVAIGGETTGTTITSNGVTWELDFGKQAEMRDQAEKLDGNQVVVTGTLQRRAGVEVAERWIVTVSKLKRAGEGNTSAVPATNDSLMASVTQPGTEIRFLTEDATTVIDITSESGLGKLSIERKSKDWPKQIHVRLHLHGLESFQAARNDGVFEWSIASGGDHGQRMTWRSGREHSKLVPSSSSYTEVKMVGGDSIPLKNGYFEVALPEALFATNPDQISLRWIDFYRN